MTRHPIAIDLLPLIAAAATAEEYEAARTCADLLANTAIIPADRAWQELRGSVIRLTRSAARQVRIDAQTQPEADVLLEFADHLDASARLLEREHLRAEWRFWRRFRRDHAPHVDRAQIHRTMRGICLAFHGNP